MYGDVAQLGERAVRIRKVESSILFISTRKTEAVTESGLCFYFIFYILLQELTMGRVDHAAIPFLLPLALWSALSGRKGFL